MGTGDFSDSGRAASICKCSGGHDIVPSVSTSSSTNFPMHGVVRLNFLYYVSGV